MFKKGQKGLTPTAMFAILMVFMVAVAYYNGIELPVIGSAQAPPGVEAEPTVVEVISTGTCDDSVTLTVDFAEKYAESTDVTAQNATIFVRSKSSTDDLGTRRGVFSEGSTLTVSQGDFINIFPALENTQTTYLASHIVGQIPCDTRAIATSDPAFKKGSMMKSGVVKEGEQAKVYRSSTASTVVAYNEDTNANLETTALAIGTGGRETAKVVIKWAYEQGYGIADGNTLACRFTDQDIDQAETTASLGGTMLTSPAKYQPSNTRFALSAANQSAKYWDFPAIDGRVTSSSTLILSIKGDATNQPTVGTNFSCEISDTDLFETDLGKVAIGVEDSDDNSNVGRSTEVLINIPVS